MNPTVEVGEKGTRITIHKNDKFCTVIQVTLKPREGYCIGVNRNDYKGTKVIEE